MTRDIGLVISRVAQTMHIGLYVYTWINDEKILIGEVINFNTNTKKFSIDVELNDTFYELDEFPIIDVMLINAQNGNVGDIHFVTQSDFGSRYT